MGKNKDIHNPEAAEEQEAKQKQDAEQEKTAKQKQKAESQKENKEEAEQAQEEEPKEQAPKKEEKRDPTPEEQLAEMKEKYLRLYAEFENYRKRTNKERQNLIKSAASELMEELLPILDDFDRTKENIDQAEEVKPIQEGVDLVYHKFYSTLQRKGLKPMETKGEKFDPETMEAVTHIPAGDEQSGLVVDEVERGYLLNDKIIRYAKVVVGQ